MVEDVLHTLYVRPDACTPVAIRPTSIRAAANTCLRLRDSLYDQNFSNHSMSSQIVPLWSLFIMTTNDLSPTSFAATKVWYSRVPLAAAQRLSSMSLAATRTLAPRTLCDDEAPQHDLQRSCSTPLAAVRAVAKDLSNYHKTTHQYVLTLRKGVWGMW